MAELATLIATNNVLLLPLEIACSGWRARFQSTPVQTSLTSDSIEDIEDGRHLSVNRGL